MHCHAAQKHEYAQDFDIADGRGSFFAQLLTQFLDRLLNLLMDSSGQKIGWKRFVIQATLERSIGSDQCVERLTYIGVHYAGGRERSLQKIGAQKKQQRLMVAQKVFRHADVRMNQSL